jgi:hydrophobic/amphiphilic exporter-1 (mainly G- bacteria), HAE1 family
LSLALGLALFLVFLVMACQFESLIKPFLVMAAAALSMGGGVSALCLFWKPVTMGVWVGALILAGLLSNAGILLLDRIENLRKVSSIGTAADLLIRAGSDRLRPIGMTTLTAVLGLVPMALSRGENSAIWSPLAVGVIGGLLAGSLMSLFVIPCLCHSVSQVLKE